MLDYLVYLVFYPFTLIVFLKIKLGSGQVQGKLLIFAQYINFFDMQGISKLQHQVGQTKMLWKKSFP